MAFAGEIAEIPIGIDGLTGTDNLFKVRVGHLLVAENISFESGNIEKEGGSSKYNDTAISGTPTIQGGWDWHPTGSSTQRMVILASDGKLYKDTGDGSFGVTLKSGLTVSNVVPVFVEGGKEAAANDRKLLIFTGSNVVQVLDADGSTTGDISSPPSDWSGSNQPTFGLLHENRMWGGGNANDPHRMYYSTTTDHENISGGGTVAVYPGEGEKIVGAISFKGLLIIWKFPRGMYIIDTSSVTVSQWSVDKHSTSIGGISPLGHVAIDNDVIFMDHGGSLHRLSAIDEFGNIGTSNLSDIAELNPLIKNEINLAELPRTQSIYYTARGEAHFVLASSGTTYDRRLVVDFNRPDLTRFRLSTKDTNRSIWLKQDGDNIDRPTTGDDAGFVWNLDQDSRSKDGSGYNGKFQTPHLDFSYLDPVLGTIQKNGKFLEIVVKPIGNFTLSVDVLWDDVLEDTIAFNMGTTGANLGSFVLGTDKLAGANLLNRRKRLTGSGRRVSLVGRNSGNGENYSVSKFYLGFMRGPDRE